MINAEDLLVKLDEIRSAIQDNTAADGSCEFDALAVMVSLKLALRCVSDAGQE